MANPVFTENSKFAPQPVPPMGYDLATGQPHDATPRPFDASTGLPVDTTAHDRMTFEGIVVRAAAFFLLTLASAVLVAMFVPQLAVILSFAAFGVSLVTMAAARKGPKPALFALTLALYGGAAGGLSRFYEDTWGGIVMQALIATAVVFAAALAVHRSGKVRQMAKIRRFLMVAVPAYVLFSLINVGMVMLGGANVREMIIPGTGMPWGLVISLVAIAVGAFMLLSDFDAAQQGVRNQLPAAWEWTAAYGLVFSVVWIYIEMLRLLSYLRR